MNFHDGVRADKPIRTAAQSHLLCDFSRKATPYLNDHYIFLIVRSVSSIRDRSIADCFLFVLLWR